MTHAQLYNRRAGTRSATAAPVFAGFKAPTSNTTYTPNQFFDVVLPNYSRGVVRIVAYLTRKTLGWCDAFGNPQEEQIEASYSELEHKAGVSRDMIRQALDDALAGHLIECVQEGRPKLAHDAGQSARYQLCWDGYKVREFQGFFEGEGNRTDIPNEFFDVVIPHEPLSVIKVVGSIIRHSIGFQAKHGRRRQQVALSYQQIEHYAKFGSRNDLAKAVRTALEKNYIVRVEQGVFSPFFGVRKSATYALCWSDNPIGQKILPAPHQSENPTSIGQNSTPANRSENPTSIKTKLEKETDKLPAVTPEQRAIFDKLRSSGFSDKVASKLSAKHSLEEVEDQIEWLPHRGVVRSPLGLLRTAIEERWAVPAKLRCTEVLHPKGQEFARFFYAAFGGNKAEPVNQPSAQESELADELVQRLLGVHSNAGMISEWGRILGKMAREQKNPFPSLTLAIRQLGDGFLVRVQREARDKVHTAKETARTEHEQKYQASYAVFLTEHENELRQTQPEDFATFHARRARARLELTQRPAAWTQTMLTHFDTEASRLHDLQSFFGLPDFWRWDAEFNSAPFNPQQP